MCFLCIVFPLHCVLSVGQGVTVSGGSNAHNTCSRIGCEVSLQVVMDRITWWHYFIIVSLIVFSNIQVTAQEPQFGEDMTNSLALLRLGSLHLFHLHLFRSRIVMNGRGSFCKIGRNPKSNVDYQFCTRIHHFSITPIMFIKCAGILNLCRPH